MEGIVPTDRLSEDGLIIFRWRPDVAVAEDDSAPVPLDDGELLRATRNDTGDDFGDFERVGYMKNNEVDAHLTETCPGIVFNQI